MQFLSTSTVESDGGVVLELVAIKAQDHINLNSLMEHPEGMQALAGLSGLGLPPVDVQWAVGAGDGAKHRATRVLPRDIDLPLYIAAESREGLKTQLRRLALALSDECNLRLIEPNGKSWKTKVHRVGGGDYVYGADTTGTYDMFMVLTLRAGDPFWTSDYTQTGDTGMFQIDVGGVPTSIPSNQGTIVNPGTVPVYPEWTIYGPGEILRLSGGGMDVKWDGYLIEGETLHIDGRTGMVRDQDGKSRYHELASTPILPPMPPGNTTVTAEWAEVQLVPERRNETPYPTGFSSVPPGWDNTDPNFNMAAVGSKLRVGGVAGTWDDDATALGSYTLTGLKPDSWYWAGIDVSGVVENHGTSTSLFEVYGTVEGLKTDIVASQRFANGTTKRGTGKLLSNSLGELAVNVRFKRKPSSTYVAAGTYTQYEWSKTTTDTGYSTEYEYRLANTVTQYRLIEYTSGGSGASFHSSESYGGWSTSYPSRPSNQTFSHSGHTDVRSWEIDSQSASDGTYSYSWGYGSPGSGWSATGNSRQVPYSYSNTTKYWSDSNVTPPVTGATLTGQTRLVGSDGFYKTTYTWPTLDLDRLLISADTDAYFDGSSTDSLDWDYAWIGTDFASKSRAVPVQTEDRAFSKVEYSFRAREWMVV